MKNIKSLRLDRNLNQQTVANYLGITQQAYANYERGVRQPDPETLTKLADFFDVSIDYLLGRDSAFHNIETFEFSSLEMSFINEIRLLNNLGQEKIIGYIEDLLNVPEYRKSETTNLKVINLPRTDGLKLIAQEEISGEAIIIEDDEVHHT